MLFTTPNDHESTSKQASSETRLKISISAMPQGEDIGGRNDDSYHEAAISPRGLLIIPLASFELPSPEISKKMEELRIQVGVTKQVMSVNSRVYTENLTCRSGLRGIQVSGRGYATRILACSRCC